MSLPMVAGATGIVELLPNYFGGKVDDCYCEGCGSAGGVWKSTSIVRAPLALVLHVKRGFVPPGSLRARKDH